MRGVSTSYGVCTLFIELLLFFDLVYVKISNFKKIYYE